MTQPSTPSEATKTPLAGSGGSVVVVVGDSVVVVGAADVVGAALVSVDPASPSASLVAGASVVGGASAVSPPEPPHADASRARAVIETSSSAIRFIGILPSGGVDTVQITDTDAVDSFIENQPSGCRHLREMGASGERLALGRVLGQPDSQVSDLTCVVDVDHHNASAAGELGVLNRKFTVAVERATFICSSLRHLCELVGVEAFKPAR